MIDNFYDFVKNKYNNINNKIIKRKYKIKYLKQKGGDYTKEIEKQIDRLIIIKEILDKKLCEAEYINFPEIVANIKLKIDNLNDYIHTFSEKSDKSDYQQFLNELTILESNINHTVLTPYTTITIDEKIKIITPPILDDKFKQSHEEFLKIIDEENQSINKLIESNEKINDAEINEQISKQIQVIIERIIEPGEEISNKLLDITIKIKEIKDYMNFSSMIIDEKLFIGANISNPEMISIKHLEIIIPEDSKQISEMRIIRNPKLMKIIDIKKKVVSPNFRKELKGGEFKYISDVIDTSYKIKNISNLTENIYEKWLLQIKEKYDLYIKERDKQEAIRKAQAIADAERAKQVEQEAIAKVERLKQEAKAEAERAEQEVKAEAERAAKAIADQKALVDYFYDIYKLDNSDPNKLQTILTDLYNLYNNLLEFNRITTTADKTILQSTKDNIFSNIYEYNEYNDIKKYIDIIDNKTIINGRKKDNDFNELFYKYSARSPTNSPTNINIENISDLLEKTIYTSKSKSKKKIIEVNIVELVTQIKIRLGMINKIMIQLGFLPLVQLKQTGKGPIKINQYNDKMEELNQYLMLYKKVYNDCNKAIQEFNILYIHLYHHQQFISNYIQVILLKQNYTIYQNISRGMVNYYYKEIKKINDLFKSKKMSNIILYFYKNHYINIQILINFFKILDENWKGEYKDGTNLLDESEKNKSRLELLKSTDEKFKLGVFVFNMFKNIIDAYLMTNNVPVAVYLRINDYSKGPSIKTFVKNDGININGTLNFDNFKNCKDTDDIVIKSTPKIDLDNLDKFKDKIKDITFKQIYDPEGFNDNTTLALYMGLPNFLSLQKSILFITYGYSGVGKTFTLFGGLNTDKIGRLDGILQKTLQSITEKEEIRMRTFEIYGLALPYKSYWQNKKPEDFNHLIHTYEYDSETLTNIKSDKKTGHEMTTYLKDIEILDDFGGSYKPISSEQISEFYNFTDNIDKIRESEGRIKKTINNPQSSRSIMVYEFKIKLSSNPSKFVSFIVMDLPGKEDIKNTYVNGYTGDAGLTKASNYGIKIKSEIGDLYNNTTALRASIFLNPMFITIFPKIAKLFIEYFKDKYSDLINSGLLVKDSKGNNVPFKIHVNYDEDDTLKDLLDPNNSFYTVKKNYRFKDKDNQSLTKLEYIYTNKYEGNMSENFKDNFKNCFLASELFRYIIKSDNIDILINFYNNKILDTTELLLIKRYAALPFEAFYINENIIGLVDILGKRLNKDYIRNDDNMMKDFFTVNAPVSYKVDSIVKTISDEPINQSYLLRNLLRYPMINNTYLLDTTNDTNFLTTATNYDVVSSKYTSPSKNNKDESGTAKPFTIQNWIENAYNYNKSFVDSKSPSPIYTFLESYFKSIDNPQLKTDKVIPTTKTHIIDNIYLFYVVSNDIKDGVNKCATQIKLISDSKEFIELINKS